MSNQTEIKSNASPATTGQEEMEVCYSERDRHCASPDDGIQWDCTSGIYETTEAKRDPVPREIAMANLPTNDEGENFYAELMDDVARLNAIRGGDETTVAAEIARVPWLTKEAIVAYLERSEKTLRDAGFEI